MPSSSSYRSMFYVILLMVVALPMRLAAQETGAIGGSVRSVDGTLLRGVELVVEAANKSTLSTNDGSFVLTGLPVGRHTITARSIGYAPVSRQIDVVPNRLTRLEIALSESAVELSAITVLGVRRYGAGTSNAAMKMDVPVLDVPQSLVVISEDFIQDQNATSLDDLLRNVSGLTPFSDYQDFTARGFRSGEDEVTFNGTKSNAVNFFASPNLHNIERVEILKGPSGVLYGSMEGGAMINMVTKSPKAISAKSFALSAGTYDDYSASADITGPINSKLLYRLTGHYDDAKSFRRFIHSKDWHIAPSLTWLPRSGTSLTAKAEYNVEDKDGARNRGTSALLDDIYGLPWDWSSNEPTDNARSDAYTAELNLGQNLFSGFKLDATTRYAYSEYENAYHESRGFRCSGGTSPTSAASLAACQTNGFRLLMQREYRHQNFRWRNFGSTGTVNGTVKTGPIEHRLLVGGDLTFKDRLTDPSDYAASIHSTGGVVTSLDLLDPVYNADPSTYVGRAPDDSPFTRDYTDWGIHASNLITIIPQIKVLVGARYNDYFVRTANFRTGASDTQNRTSTTRRLGLVLQPLKWTTLYGNFNEGFKPQTASNDERGGPFDPLVTRQYEGGFKLGFFGERLIASGSLYRIRKLNVVVPDPLPEMANHLAALGEVNSRGYEGDIVGTITPNWSVTANYAHNKTVISKDPRLTQVGASFPNAPRNQSAFWTRYDIPNLHLGFAAGMTKVGKRETFDDAILPRYTVFDGAVYFDWNRYKFQLNAKNLTDERYFSGGYQSYQLYSGSPRTIQGSVRATF
jgi:iron complex outermembrane recepter protein